MDGRDLAELAAVLAWFQTDVGWWSQRNFPSEDTYRALLGVAEEVGELCHAHLKAEQGIRGTPEEHRAAKLDAVGDVVVYLADYCARNGLDLGQAVAATWASVRERDWVKFPGDGRTR
jgi:NTP pyrophosphatase (non-canonical NTP hydrolase)